MPLPISWRNEEVITIIRLLQNEKKNFWNIFPMPLFRGMEADGVVPVRGRDLRAF